MKTNPGDTVVGPLILKCEILFPAWLSRFCQKTCGFNKAAFNESKLKLANERQRLVLI